MSTTSDDDLLRQASFVFVGTISQLAGSTMPEVHPGPDTAVVDIERVLVAPPAFAGRRGAVTLALPEGSKLKVGAQRAFYCTAWKLGSGLALRCLAHRSAPATEKAISPNKAAASVNVKGEDLRTRLRDADLVASAVVLAVQPLPRPDGPISEHDPYWHAARLRVENVAQGAAQGDELTLVFPASDDVVWAQAPRPQLGERGVWALRSTAAPAPRSMQPALRALPPQVYTALHPLDFQPQRTLSALRSLMGVLTPRRRPAGSGR